MLIATGNCVHLLFGPTHSDRRQELVTCHHMVSDMVTNGHHRSSHGRMVAPDIVTDHRPEETEKKSNKYSELLRASSRGYTDQIVNCYHYTLLVSRLHLAHARSNHIGHDTPMDTDQSHHCADQWQASLSSLGKWAVCSRGSRAPLDTSPIHSFVSMKLCCWKCRPTFKEHGLIRYL